MTLQDIIKARLVNQQIAETKFTKPHQIVSWMGAIQAQDFGMAKWAIGLRLPGSLDAAIEQAFNNGDILRTHVLRPTWHFVSPIDIRWMVNLTAPRIVQLMAYNERKLGLDKKIFNRANDVLAKTLSGGKQLTRDEIRLLFQTVKIPTNDLRFTHLVMHAELDGVICSGPRRGNQFTYALLDERAPNAKSMDFDEALATLAKRFFTSRGLATVNDFAWWSGLPVAHAKRGSEMVKRSLRKEIVEDREYFYGSFTQSPAVARPGCYLLPNYDEYLVGYSDRTAVLNKKYRPLIASQRNAIFSNSIIVNGKIEGTWRRATRKDSVVVVTRHFGKITKTTERAVTKAVKTYCSFLDRALAK